jgi:hypothetical protein
VALALPLVTALAVLSAVAVGAHFLGRGDADWVRP